MSENRLWLFVCRPVALALAGLVGIAAFKQLFGTRLQAAGPLSGRAIAVDGDTLDLAGQRVRLEGIDAPELSQTCGRRWIGSWNCGRAAQKALDRLIGGRRVECDDKGKDKYDRSLGICRVDGRDINAELVRLGMAWAFVKYSDSYVNEEKAARAGRVGIWQGDAEPPWTFREHKWSSAEGVAPKGCAIKGNVTENGRIYHVPWSEWYDKVKIQPENGERWFCNESEAVTAGWRPSAAR